MLRRRWWYEPPAHQSKNMYHKLQGTDIEFLMIVLLRSTQICAGLKKRNGSGMKDQLLNHAEPPFCRSLHDTNLLLIQFALCHDTVS